MVGGFNGLQKVFAKKFVRYSCWVISVVRRNSSHTAVGLLVWLDEIRQIQLMGY